MDGTILSLETLYYKLFSDVLHNVWGVENFNKHDFLTELAGRKVTKSLSDFLDKRNIKYDKNDLIGEISNLRHKRNILLQESFHKYVHIKPGIKDLLKYLKENGLQTALATSSSRKTTISLLKGSKLEKYFDVVVTGDDVKNSKPNPETFEKAIKLLRADKANTIIFEDSINGLKAAHLSNVACVIAVHTPGFNDEVVKNEENIISSYEPLLNILQG